LFYNDGKKKESKSFLIYCIIYGLNMLFGKGLINVDCHVNTCTCVYSKSERQKSREISHATNLKDGLNIVVLTAAG
jgi:hypothetical protein